METNLKIWKKTAEGNYAFYKQDQKIGNLSIQTNLFEKRATFDIDNQQFNVKHTGFWKNNIEISNANDQVVLKTYAEKWYSNSVIIAFEDRKLKLNIRNNPLAEYAILEGDKEILTYGLSVNDGKVTTKIQTSLQNKSYLLDFFLWYLFFPIALENMGDDLTFLLLSVA